MSGVPPSHDGHELSSTRPTSVLSREQPGRGEGGGGGRGRRGLLLGDGAERVRALLSCIERNWKLLKVDVQERAASCYQSGWWAADSGSDRGH